MKQWPVLRMMIRMFFCRANLTPAWMSLGFWARIAYWERNPRVHSSGHPSGGPGWPVAVFGGQVLLLQMGIMGMVG
jgi:hypothetical protein